MKGWGYMWLLAGAISAGLVIGVMMLANLCSSNWNCY